MEEEWDFFGYRWYQHFITNSKRGHLGLIRVVQTQATDLLAAQKTVNGLPVGLNIDQSSYLKKCN